ncbi:winged helix-turn-helix transcriptional regulator [Candidatus Woesearchaeota archaeon]|jgi:nitrogen fixation/metabolism regulation signal transduction histidine kinase|nr:winged helix-turn-helix transcriptional regulator [Candidatus Woesearchaeota archaeon]MBT7928372.1 winged helix-turn-helix transcriptional regulator [Candidatus Peregrinibacteria bacterium]MBT3538248.1 winged helix-turn-helix transcriptional regulator [Candidatus Woesearchaeota archaeon]MBT4697702.1 winged helix-turn-helix transcriptional regulator [Candidatus Woesearchaeota archaeon]MBT4717414.1 winged helix-turn-helix transcriptional regulator [Candidatus Woesearchaeota archaeon]
MKLKHKLTADLVTFVVIFAVIILLVTFTFFRFNVSLNSLINEAEPTLKAMDHMLLDVYQDNILLLDYLNTQNYNEALDYDKEVEISDLRCARVEDDLQTLIVLGVISDQNTIDQYGLANELHHDVEAARNKLLILHKKELATNENLTLEKNALLDEHGTLFREAVNKFTDIVDNVDKRNKVLRTKLLFQSRVYFFFLFALIVIFLVVLLFRIRSFSLVLVKPIREMIDKIDTFVDGNFKIRIKSSEDISEISDLQTNLNNVFSVVEAVANRKPAERTSIESKLLKQEHLDVINLVKNNALKKRKTTMTDIRKSLDITHPTAISRIKILKEKGYIELEKDGRDKLVNLTSKVDF